MPRRIDWFETREGEAPTEPGRPSQSQIRGRARLRPSRAGHRNRGVPMASIKALVDLLM
jgi:hypothetical protein